MVTTQLTRDDVLGIFEQIKNWGRWGADDERGTLNFITADQRRRATATVRDGVAVSCALPLNTTPSDENSSPLIHYMVRGGDIPDASGSADYFAIATHGMAHTHLDALCHIFHDGKMYNGYPQAQVTSRGALKNAITSGEHGVVSRGVLLDIPPVRGAKYLEPGDQIHPADLEAAEQRQGVRVEEGDILLVRTGRWLRKQEQGHWNGRELLAGLYADCLPWLHERRVAALGSDGVSDVIPSGVARFGMPIHVGAIVMLGLHLIDNANLEELASACAERNRYAFLLTLAPLRLVHGTGCPINPIALF
ncbi:MAG: cyclase family protein [Dehalococcoidia bacterium]